MRYLNTFLNRIEKKAKSDPKRIVFPEATDERVLKAVQTIKKKKIAVPILIGNQRKILKKAKKLNISLKDVAIIDPAHAPELKGYIKNYYYIRKHKAITEKEAAAAMKDPVYFGTMMVEEGHADGLISGAVHTTAHTLKAALRIIGTKKPFHKVSGIFFMVFKDNLLIFGDSAVNIEPTAEELADIADDTAITAKSFGIRPRIALLSFSTHGSAQHPLVDKMKRATILVNKRHPDIIIDGELQVDAALVPEVAKRKCPKSNLKGNANVLIFPGLETGNIAYKLVERTGNAKAIGPILQGLKKPINDLSRGCSIEDIVHVCAITVVQAQGI